MKTYRQQEGGFVALVSVIIISAILLTMIFVLGASSFFARFDALDQESKRVSLGLAEACANMAMVKLAQNSSYVPASGGDCVSVSDTCGAFGATRVCRICQVSGALTKTILVRARYNGAYTTISVSGTIGSTNFNVTNWSEIATYGGVTCTVP